MTKLSDRRAELRRDPLLTEKIIYAVGPQHPSLPAPYMLEVQADGELIEHVRPDIGYMHRGVEQLCTKRTWAQCSGLLSRTEWLAGSNGDYLLSAAVEEIAGIEVPQRAQWLRTMVLELSRIASHLFWWGQLGLEAGAITPIFWAVREREGVIGLLEELSGHRWHHQWIVPGGVRTDVPQGFIDRVGQVLLNMEDRVHEFEEFLSDNAIWVNRSELIGVLEPEYALTNGASGPVLRGSGIVHDLRRDAPYLKYDELDVRIPVGEFGDVLDRYRIRMMEIQESTRLVRECFNHLADSGEAYRVEAPVDVPKGEAYVAVEGPRGELGLSAVSEGGPNPARLHLRGPSLYHLFLLDELCRGYLLADLFVILGSLDIMVGEVDR